MMRNNKFVGTFYDLSTKKHKSYYSEMFIVSAFAISLASGICFFTYVKGKFLDSLIDGCILVSVFLIISIYLYIKLKSEKILLTDKFIYTSGDPRTFLFRRKFYVNYNDIKSIKIDFKYKERASHFYTEKKLCQFGEGNYLEFSGDGLYKGFYVGLMDFEEFKRFYIDLKSRIENINSGVVLDSVEEICKEFLKHAPKNKEKRE